MKDNFLGGEEDKIIIPEITNSLDLKKTEIKKKPLIQRPRRSLAFLKFISVFLVFLLIMSGISSAFLSVRKAKNWGGIALSAVSEGVSKKDLNYFDKAQGAIDELDALIHPLVYRSFSENINDAESMDSFLKMSRELAYLPKVFAFSVDEISVQEKNPLKIIEIIEKRSAESLGHIKKSQEYLEIGKKGNYAQKYIEEIEFLENKLVLLSEIITQSTDNLKGIKALLGYKEPHTVLFVLQNSHEIRPTGGFIGSLYFVTFDDGKIVSREFRDVYDFDSNLGEQVNPPEPFNFLADNWGLRDANYYSNFPDSAKQIQWFLEHEKGSSVDSIVAIDEQAVEAFLALMKPLELDGNKVNADNFSFVLSFIVEAKVFGQSSPKKVLENFIPVFEEELSGLSYAEKVNVFFKLVAEKHITAYSFRQDTQKLFRDIGVNGEYDFSKDRLLVSQTSFSANKSDGFIDEKIAHKTLINLDGDIVNNLKIIRTHTWGEEENQLFSKLYSKYAKSARHSREAIEMIMGRSANRVWTRVYVEKGSVLNSFKGADEVKVLEENNATVFAFYYPVISPEESAEVEISYTLPEKLNFSHGFDNHEFCFEKSAGISSNVLIQNISLESGLVLAESTEKMPYIAEVKGNKCIRMLFTRESML